MSLQSHDHVERIKHVRRPKKTPAERARRQKAQLRRLVALGVPQAEAERLQPIVVRTMLKRPKKVVQALARRAAAAEA